MLKTLGTSLVVQWLRLRASTVGGMGSIPVWGTKIPHAAQRVAKKIEEKKKPHKMLKSLNALFGEVTGTFYLLASYAGYPETL